MKKTKLLTSLAALALVVGLGACDGTTQECETCPVCPEVTEPSDEDEEAWATTPAELIEMASEARNYSVELEFDVLDSAVVMDYTDYNRLFALDDALYYLYDPDQYDETTETYKSLWDDENNTWAEGGEDRYAELYAEFLELYDVYENLFYDLEVTSSYVVDIFVDEDYMLAVTYEWQDVTDYSDNAEVDSEYEYVFDSLDMYVSDGEGGCIEITYGLERVSSFPSYTYEYQWKAYAGSYPWEYYEYSLFFAGAYNFDGFFDYYGSGTLSGIPCTAWTVSDDASFWGLEFQLAYMLGAYTYWQGDYTSYPDYMAYYYTHYLTYFIEDYQEMISDFYVDGFYGHRSGQTYDYVYYEDEEIYIDLYDVGATDATDEINAVITAYNASLVPEEEPDD